MVMVLDTVGTNIVGYYLNFTEADPGNPLYNQTFIEPIPANTAIVVPGQQWGRYFQLTNQLPAGNWLFTLQGVDANKTLTQMSSNTFERYQEYFSGVYAGSEQGYSGTSVYVGTPIPVVGYTNNNSIKEPVLAQILRAESDTWTASQQPTDFSFGPPSEAIMYDTNFQSLTTEGQWGTLTFQCDPSGQDYYAVDLASYFTSICATPDTSESCGGYYANPYTGVGYLFPGSELASLQIEPDGSGNSYFVMPDDSWGPDYRFNPAGLEYLSVTYQIGSGSPITLTNGQSNMVSSNSFKFEVAINTETPSFQPINYYFDGRNYPMQSPAGYTFQSRPPANYVLCSSLPVDDWIMSLYGGVPVASTNPVIVAQVGKPVNLQSWSQLIAIRPDGSPITNQFCWIDQDFAQAYLCDPATGDVARTSQTNYNGKFKIDTTHAIPTGILSPNLNFPLDYSGTHGIRSADFTPTQPGKVIVTTMPDTNGFYGEVTIYVIDMQADANHDGVMDTRALTSVNNPDVFWVNNDVGRWHSIDYGTRL